MHCWSFPSLPFVSWAQLSSACDEWMDLSFGMMRHWTAARSVSRASWAAQAKSKLCLAVSYVCLRSVCNSQLRAVVSARSKALQSTFKCR